jgi:hypothetical protein
MRTELFSALPHFELGGEIEIKMAREMGTEIVRERKRETEISEGRWR